MPIDYQDEMGLTLLHVAAQNGNKRVAKLCLRRGADINKRNNNGQVSAPATLAGGTVLGAWISYS